MKCPKCEGTLVEMERFAARINVCPFCQGIWLAQGGLEKILDYTRSTELPFATMATVSTPFQQPANLRHHHGHDHHDHHDDHDDDDHSHGEHEDRRPQFGNAGHDRPHDVHDDGDRRHNQHRRRKWYTQIFDIFD